MKKIKEREKQRKKQKKEGLSWDPKEEEEKHFNRKKSCNIKRISRWIKWEWEKKEKKKCNKRRCIKKMGRETRIKHESEEQGNGKREKRI